MKTQQMIKKALVQIEKVAPSITSRVWGLWQDPMAEILGLQVRKLNETQIEVGFKNFDRSPNQFLKAAELGIKVLWKRHLRGGLETISLTQCNFDLRSESLEQHFVARSELLENDRERVLAEARSGQSQAGPASCEAVVLIFDLQDHLVAQAHYTVKIKSLLPLALQKGEMS